MILWDPEVWIPRYKTIDSTQLLSELLPIRLKQYVNYYVEKDAILSTYLAKGTHALVLSCTLRVPGTIGTLEIPLHEDPRVEFLGDLTKERSSQESVIIAADLNLSLQARLKSRRPKIAFDDPIQTTSYIDNNEVEPLKWCCVGHVQITEEDGVVKCTKRKQRFWECVAYCKPLLAHYEPTIGSLQLYTLPAYHFVDFTVGDVRDRQVCNMPELAAELFTLFGHPRWGLPSDKELLGRVSKYFNEEVGERLPNDLPFLPTLCYNVFRAADFGLGMNVWPKKDIDLAVRCVNHYTPTRDVQFLEFPRDIRLTIKEREGLDDLCIDVSGCIDFSGMKDGVKVNSKIIFSPRHRGKWEMQFWVMPQRQRKLYRYTQGQLSQFLDDSSDVRRRWDKKLYLEAHIVPKR